MLLRGAGAQPHSALTTEKYRCPIFSQSANLPENVISASPPIARSNQWIVNPREIRPNRPCPWASSGGLRRLGTVPLQLIPLGIGADGRRRTCSRILLRMHRLNALLRVFLPRILSYPVFRTLGVAGLCGKRIGWFALRICRKHFAATPSQPPRQCRSVNS
jgi:hypothetical protein